VTRTAIVDSTAALPVRPDGSLRLAVIADTHSSPHPSLIGQLRDLKPDAVLHAGDIGDLSVLDPVRAVAPLFVVRGNIDVRALDLPDVLVLQLTSAERSVFRILLTHIAVNGPKLRADVARRARAAAASLVVCGHSHVPFIGRDKGVAVFNPGSAGPRRFRLPIVFGVIDVLPAGRDVRLSHVDCETGKPWFPPGAPDPSSHAAARRQL